MGGAIVFSDVHISEDDAEGVARLERFIDEVCRGAERVFILGDLFDFWFGPRQALEEPYKGVLERIAALASDGTKVKFFHGNRDSYIDSALGERYGFEVVEDYSIEAIGGRKVLMCHGDSLCTNDVGYRCLRAVVRNPYVRATLKQLPAFIARWLARMCRTQSKRSVAAKPDWVLELDEEAVREHFALGADAIILGHTHKRREEQFDVGGGVRTLYALGNFGVDGCYLECGDEGFVFKSARSGR